MSKQFLSGVILSSMVSLFSYSSGAVEIDLFHADDVTDTNAQSLKTDIEQYYNFLPACFVKSDRLQVNVISESSGASASVVMTGGPDDEIAIPTIEIPFKYFAADSFLKKQKVMSDAHRNAVIFHELSHGLFNASLKLKEIKNIWPEAEALIESQKLLEQKVDALAAEGKTTADAEMKKANSELEQARAAVDQLWIQNPDKAKNYSLYRNNKYIFSTLTEFMADLMTVVYLKTPDIIMQALTPFPKEHQIPSAQLRRFTPFNSAQLKDVLSPIYYSDLSGYLAPIENTPEFEVYRSQDVRDAHLALAPTRVHLWNRYFKGKTLDQQKSNLCQVLNVINDQFNSWGAWRTTTPEKLNKSIIESFEAQHPEK